MLGSLASISVSLRQGSSIPVPNIRINDVTVTTLVDDDNIPSATLILSLLVRAMQPIIEGSLQDRQVIVVRSSAEPWYRI